MASREDLQKSNNALKRSLEDQLKDIKGNIENTGKTALWIGGGLFGVYLLVSAMSGSKKKSKAEKVKKAKKHEVHSSSENLLTSTVKEQAIIFLLGLAATKLAAFLKELESDEAEKDS